MAKRVIIVDDDDTALFIYRLHFKAVPDIEIVETFEKAEDALAKVPLLKPDVIITDYQLPGMSGIDFVEEVSQHSGIKTILVTGYDLDYIPPLKKPLDLPILFKDWTEKSMNHLTALCLA